MRFTSLALPFALRAVHFIPLHFVAACLTIHLVHLVVRSLPLSGRIISLQETIACLAIKITGLGGKRFHLSGKIVHLPVRIEERRGKTRQDATSERAVQSEPR